MNKNMIISLMSIITLLTGCATDSGVRLELEPSVRTLRLGDSSTLKLSIAGSSVSAITADAEGVITRDEDNASFVRLIPIKAVREGRLVFGPYSLQFNGKQLTSEAVSISVLPEWEGTFGTYYHVGKKEIALGTDFELMSETWSKEYDRKKLLIKRGDDFEYKSGPLQGGTRTVAKKKVHYSKRSWLITPNRAGTFRVTKDIFREFPEGTEPPDITITVK